MLSRPPVGKENCNNMTPDGIPLQRRPSGVFSCYQLVARSKAGQDRYPYSPKCLEGEFSELHPQRDALPFDDRYRYACVMRRDGGTR